MKKIIFLIIFTVIGYILYRMNSKQMPIVVKNKNAEQELNKSLSKEEMVDKEIYDEELLEEEPPKLEPMKPMKSSDEKPAAAATKPAKELSQKLKAMKEKYISKVANKPEPVKKYHYGLWSFMSEAPAGMNYNSFVNKRSNNIIKCQELDGGRFYFVIDLVKSNVILFDYKVKSYIFHTSWVDSKIEEDNIIYTASEFRKKYSVHYDFRVVLSKSNKIGEGQFYYKNASKEHPKDKAWPFNCEVTN